MWRTEEIYFDLARRVNCSVVSRQRRVVEYKVVSVRVKAVFFFFAKLVCESGFEKDILSILSSFHSSAFVRVSVESDAL